MLGGTYHLPEDQDGRGPHGGARREYGADRIIINSAADWGISDPLKVPKTIAVMRANGIGDDLIQRIVWDNPVAFFSQSGQLDVASLEARPEVARTERFETNSILRGDPLPPVR